MDRLFKVGFQGCSCHVGCLFSCLCLFSGPAGASTRETKMHSWVLILSGMDVSNCDSANVVVNATADCARNALALGVPKAVMLGQKGP